MIDRDTGCKKQANLSMRTDETRWINHMTGVRSSCHFLLVLMRIFTFLLRARGKSKDFEMASCFQVKIFGLDFNSILITFQPAVRDSQAGLVYAYGVRERCFSARVPEGRTVGRNWEK